MFLGQYEQKIENGKIEFPWGFSEDEKLTWYIAEATRMDKITIHCGICNAGEFEHFFEKYGWQTNEIRLLDQGTVFVDDDGFWQVPSAISEYFESDDVIMVGACDFIDIFSPRDLIESLEAFDEAQQELLELDFEVDSEDDNTK